MQATVQQGSWQKQWGLLVAKAWSDENLKERLIADLEHDARSWPWNSAELGMKFAPAAMVGREGETSRRLHFSLRGDLGRVRQRLAHVAAIDRRPGAAGENDRSARIGWTRCGQRRGNQDKSDLHGRELTRI